MLFSFLAPWLCPSSSSVGCSGLAQKRQNRLRKKLMTLCRGFSSCSQQSPALSVVFSSCMQVICYPRPKKKKKELMVSVHSLDVIFKKNKGAMLPSALIGEGPDGAGRTGCSFWVNLRLGWVLGRGMGCGALGYCNKEFFGTSAWHCHRAERMEGGSGGERALLCSTFEAKRFY